MSNVNVLHLMIKVFILNVIKQEIVIDILSNIDHRKGQHLIVHIQHLTHNTIEQEIPFLNRNMTEVLKEI